jgi:hypothetical protein
MGHCPNIPGGDPDQGDIFPVETEEEAILIDVLEITSGGGRSSDDYVDASNITAAILMIRNGAPERVRLNIDAPLNLRAPIFTYMIDNHAISTNNAVASLAYHSKNIVFRHRRRRHNLENYGDSMRDREQRLLSQIAGILGKKWLEKRSDETLPFRNTKAVRLQILYCMARRLSKTSEHSLFWDGLSEAIVSDYDWATKRNKFRFWVME